MDLSERGWTIRQGQAVWKAKPDGADIAGDLLVAMHWNGRSVVQFTKPPLPFVAAQRDTNSWQIQFFAQNKTYSGRGRPPERIVWLQLPDNLVGQQPDSDWTLIRSHGGAWSFTNHLSGESLNGFLNTTTLPPAHRVQPGEHLLKVARRYGVTMEAIRAVNPGRETEWFRVGGEIRLPAVTPQAQP